MAALGGELGVADLAEAFAEVGAALKALLVALSFALAVVAGDAANVVKEEKTVARVAGAYVARAVEVGAIPKRPEDRTSEVIVF